MLANINYHSFTETFCEWNLGVVAMDLFACGNEPRSLFCGKGHMANFYSLSMSWLKSNKCTFRSSFANITYNGIKI